MNHSPKGCSVLICLSCAMATPVLAQQPPDPVASDSLANTAMGTNALLNVELSQYGCHNTASGENALYSDTGGSYNTATGFNSLYSNTMGNDNTAAGYESLYSNQTGDDNTASGYQALYNSSGSNNIALGSQAGFNLTAGSRNIDIGNKGAAGDHGKMRLGTEGQQVSTYIAGINGSVVTGAAVYVTSTGQLGVLASSERYKTDVASMGASSAGLEQLRPVTFRLKTDPQGAVQYGLIAEEVAKVYPELVIRNEAGRIEGVHYEELAPMLLNEMQQQQAEIRDLKNLVVEMQAGLLQLQAKDARVAER